MIAVLAQLLAWLADGMPGPLNAALYAEAIVEGLQRGYLRLDGTLDAATVILTPSGQRRIDDLRRAGVRA